MYSVGRGIVKMSLGARIPYTRTSFETEAGGSVAQLQLETALAISERRRCLHSMSYCTMYFGTDKDPRRLALALVGANQDVARACALPRE